MDIKEDDFYWFWLSNIPKLGNVKIRELLNLFGDVKEIYSASEDLLTKSSKLTKQDVVNIMISKQENAINEKLLMMKEKGIHFIHLDSENYPLKLKEIYDAPYNLYYKGKLPDNQAPTVAIIGARDCTNYGKEVASIFGQEFAKIGVQVISGMARGIDAYGHIGCLNGGGNTFAVLGCSADICYPKENINLYMEIQEKGGIISEYPPGTQPLAYQFPMRNRIISGLADVVIVVEAREKSGSLITVDQALEQNKEVMVVPGRIGDRLSEGCNNLIKLGAQIITTPEDALENLGILKEQFQKDRMNNKDILKENNITLACQEKMVYSCVDLFPKNINNIIEETHLDMNVITSILLNLELKNYIKEISKNYYVRVINSEQFSEKTGG